MLAKFKKIFKPNSEGDMNSFKYFTIIFTTTLILIISILFVFMNHEQTQSPEDEIVEFNFRIDGKHYIIPSPFHSFDFLNELKFDWSNLADPSTNTDYSDQTQVSILLGMRAADGIVFLYTDDKENARLMRSRVIDFADKLSITPDIKDAISQLDQAVILNSDKPILKDRLMDVEYQIERSLHKNKKDNLAVLVELGGWLQGLYLVSKGINKNYNPRFAEVLRQPHIAEIYIEVLTSLSKRATTEKEKNLLNSVLNNLSKIYDLTNHTHKEPYPPIKVKQLYEIAKETKLIIEKK